MINFSHYTAEKKKKIKVNIGCIVLLFIHTSKKISELTQHFTSRMSNLNKIQMYI